MECTNSKCRAQIPDNSLFCNYCGTPMEQLQTCPNGSCGRSNLPKEACFCPDCGTSLGKKAQLKIPAGFVRVEGGTFTMEGSESDEKPLHAVTLDTFYMGKYQVTQGQWKERMGGNPSCFEEKNHPVEQVSWYAAVAFAIPKKKVMEAAIFSCG